MNAAIATEGPISRIGPSAGPRANVASLVAAANRRLDRLSRRQRMLATGALVGALFAAAVIAAGPRTVAYLGVFGFSALANAILFLPSGRGAIMVAGAVALDPLAVAILTGVGGAIGEITGYALGRSSRALPRRVRFPGWLTRGAERHMAATILAVSIIPNPFVDAIGIVAGRLGYPLRLFLAYSIVGKVAQSIVFVYVALWNLSLIGSWLDLGL